ncbi:MAG TPA: protease HtpX [Candidatus Limnocylindria bacterium]|jgi:heat shock protein HtpX|nr:protease HtpX [Candidatus Limnocylindria bacterium]
MKRIVLFSLTNIAVLVSLSVVAHLLGLDQWLSSKGIPWVSLLVFSLVFGFAGSMVSLLISRWMAVHAYNIQIIESPNGSEERWLVNSVSELTTRAGIPMPQVGIYDSPEANAFATGPSRNKALVAVSSGLLNQMSENEIRGVLAHEVGHISNGDMVTMSLLQGVLNTFVMFFAYLIGIALDSAMRGNRDDRYRGPGIGSYIGRMIAQIVLGLLASLITMAYSRSREFAADRLSAQINGKQSMISALRKLQRIHDTGGVFDNRAESLATFKISNPTTSFLGRLLASHPPLEERIAALEQV